MDTRFGGEAAGTTTCPSCGAAVPAMEGPTHRYMLSAPGCWHVYGEVLAREYQDPTWGAVHRLSVDSYAVQHPGAPTPRAVRSVCVHLLSLCLVLERGVALDTATRALGAAALLRDRYAWLEPPPGLGTITVADVRAAATAAEHAALVRAWAESAWAAWAPHHERVRSWLPPEP